AVIAVTRAAPVPAVIPAAPSTAATNNACEATSNDFSSLLPAPASTATKPALIAATISAPVAPCEALAATPNRLNASAGVTTPVPVARVAAGAAVHALGTKPVPPH